jgi:hypothetical protein
LKNLKGTKYLKNLKETGSIWKIWRGLKIFENFEEDCKYLENLKRNMKRG